MSAKRKKEAAPPAQAEAVGPEPDLQDSNGTEEHGEHEEKASPSSSCSSVEASAVDSGVEPVDPWAASKASGFDAQRIVQRAQSLGVERSEGGVMLVTPAVLVALGMGEDRAREAVEKARAWSCDLATTEGGRVYALSAPGRVAIQSYAKRPRTARVLAYVREPSRLRAGDEVGFVYSASGMAEVKYGR